MMYLSLGDGSKLSEEACRALGFTPNLVCASCDLLDEFNLVSLKSECHQCCQEGASGEDTLKVYPYAELRVCQ